jgi:hypothetical protein
MTELREATNPTERKIEMTEIEHAQDLLQIPVIRLIVMMRRKGVSIRAIAMVFGESKSTPMAPCN